MEDRSSSSSSIKRPKSDNKNVKDRVHFVNCVWRWCRRRISSIRNGGNHILSNWRILVFGQVYSLIMAFSLGFAASLVFECNLSSPAAMLSFNYILQSFHLVALLSCWRRTTKSLSSHPSSSSSQLMTYNLKGRNDDNKKSDDNDNTQQDESRRDDMMTTTTNNKYYLGCGPTFKIPIHMSVWMYLLAALLHFEGNYFNFLALRYTTMTSVSLIDGFAIPSALIFSRLLLHKKYRKIHLIGVTLCFVGILTNFGADMHTLHHTSIPTQEEVEEGGSSQWPHLVRGDMLALICSIFCGLSDVLNEVILKKYKASTNEYMGMIGFFGTFIGIFQAILFEREDISNFFSPVSRIRVGDEPEVIGEDFTEGSRSCSETDGWLFLVGFVLATYMSYVLMNRFLLISEAGLLNLSLITADFWSVGFVVVVEHIKPEPLFFLSLCFTISGLLIYQSGPIPAEKDEYIVPGTATFPMVKNKELEIT